ncbi:putative membrane protein [Candidatus Protofrankia californiensis]|uniref:Putative membrane protein n=1 Tax=Candidatus Protofrankia californiensis TaxID=1839754 RepID=A0A1C3NVL7_9ACTN|nr:putative membrane protein [Candidatus Protofrankia californiensis]
MLVAFAPVTAADVGLPDPRAVTAAIPLLLAAVLMWRRWLPRVAACLTLFAGIGLTSGWLAIAVHQGVAWVTRFINLVTRTAVGGVAPGALAIVLLIFFILEMRPEPGALGRLRDPRPALVRAGGGRTGRPAGRSHRSGMRAGRGRPGKLAAAGVGLVLPSVAATMTGDLGAVVLSALNVIGGAFAWPLSLAWGVA